MTPLGILHYNRGLLEPRSLTQEIQISAVEMSQGQAEESVLWGQQFVEQPFSNQNTEANGCSSAWKASPAAQGSGWFVFSSCLLCSEMTAAPQPWKQASSQSTGMYLLNTPERIALLRPGMNAASVFFQAILILTGL